jgi:hypothetical protein
MPVTAATPTSMPTGHVETYRRGRAELGLASALSVGAAAIHLAAGPAHVESLGDLGLGFYWAALFQGAFAVALMRRSVSRRLAWIGIGLNVVLVAAWAWSRVVGLPDVPGGPEAVGVADGTAVLLQLALVGLLAGRVRRIDTRRRADRPDAPSSFATAGFAMLLGLVLVSTTFAVADAASGHGHDEGTHDHLSSEPTPGAAGHQGASSDH